jgi:hypothetical protein
VLLFGVLNGARDQWLVIVEFGGIQNQRGIGCSIFRPILFYRFYVTRVGNNGGELA